MKSPTATVTFVVKVRARDPMAWAQYIVEDLRERTFGPTVVVERASWAVEFPDPAPVSVVSRERPE